ncbi:magnesium and cobalt transport protein CorA [Candidatus Micrarchaeota archaeon RBG_16_49_10]|nr:MAG: magnesium and cobalt transport protein CorA [Candidatus Micrarchaeota archaeon RBG_16_49_10]
MIAPATRSKKTGFPPGSLVHIGKKKTQITTIKVIEYNEEAFEEREAKTVEECFGKKAKTVKWINIDGIHDIGVIEKIGKHFDMHPLMLEDILNTEQRPKIEYYDGHIFIVLKTLEYYDIYGELKVEQISLIVGPDFVITFMERESTIFDSVKARLRSGKGRIRKHGSDYLAYTLLDAIVDNYFVILEKLGDKIEDLEENLIKNPTAKTLNKIQGLKKDMIFLRRSLWPLREVIKAFEREEVPLIKKATKIYLKDVYDHTIQVIDTVETYRDLVSGMLDIYLSSISNRMNEVMKTLTIISTIFIPLTFLAGIYGMNFRYMPELEWKNGYLLFWIIILVVLVIMVKYFKRQKWI